MRLASWSIAHVKPLIFVTVALSLAGILIYGNFPVAILPEVTFPRVVAIAESGDLPTNRVEVMITRPLEEGLATIPNVQRIRSKTKRGSTEVNVDFLPGTDVIVAEQFVNAKVNQVLPEFPAGTATEVERMNATVFPVLGLTLSSKSLTQTELWNLATYTIKPRLARVEGVARVIVQGGRPPEIEVAIDPNALAGFNLSSKEVADAITAANDIRAVGRLDHEFKRFQVTVTGETTTPEQVGEIVVAESNGQPIHVRQVAKVHSSTEEQTTVVSANGEESVLINVVRQPTGNSVAMVEAVRKELAALKGDLPADVRTETFYDQSLLIREAVNSVRDAVIIGAALSVFVLLLYLGSIRATLVTASILPMTLLISFVLMRLFGQTLNLMTLGALAVGIGLVIDTAIVIVEAVFKQLETTANPPEAVQIAASQIAAPLVSSTITTVVVFVPLAFLAGVAGAFFSALALTLTIALMVSLALALFISPSHCSAFMRSKDAQGGERKIYSRVVSGYEKLLRALLRRRWSVAPIIVVTLFGTWLMGTRLQTGFMPAMDEGAFVLDYLSPPGTSLAESDRLLRKVDAILKDTPEVASFSRRLGTELGFAITESNSGDYAVMLKPDRRRNIEEVMADVRQRVESQVPGLEVEFIQVLQDLIGDLAGTPNPIEIKLFGENKREVEAIAAQVAKGIGKIPGVVDVKSGAIESGPEVVFQVDPSEAGRRGLTAQSVADQADALLIGAVATEVLQSDRQVPVRVRLPFKDRNTIDGIGRIGIESPKGRVQLRDLASVQLVQGTTQTAREDQRRLVAVTAGLDGIDLGTAITAVRKELSKVAMPAGVSVAIGGQFLSQQESFRNFAIVLGAALVLVFTVMVFQFRSFVAPIVILVLMPLALFGAVLALFVTGTALNVSSFMGVIMLAGIVVKNGILLLDRAQHQLEKGATPEEAVLEAGSRRLRPILMTTLTALFGLFPLALGIGAGAEMQQPLAIAVIGGLTFSTILTLIIGPVLYASITSRAKRTHHRASSES